MQTYNKGLRRFNLGVVGLALGAGLALWVVRPGALAAPATPTAKGGKFKVVKTDAEWRKALTPAQYNVLRQAGTEAPFSGKYESQGKGIYVCAACGQPLFASDTQFDSGTGWPSFFQPLSPKDVIENTDTSLGMSRTEVICSRCGSHLGHVFDDGPKPTGLRYCMNAVAMKFEKGVAAPAQKAPAKK